MALISSWITLLISIIIVVFLVFRKVNVGIALALGAILYGTLSLGAEIFKATVDAFDLKMFQTLVALTLSMFLADIYNSVGASRLLIESFEVIGPRFAAFSTPAVIGLLPMPGGAYVSAVVVDPLYNDMRLKSDVKTFINYWFRHLWITTWPLYQGVILASGLLGLSSSYIMMLNMPITLSALVSGIIFGYREINKNTYRIKKAHSSNLKKIVHAWPFISIALLSIVFNLNIVLSIAVTLIIFILVYRPVKEKLIHALKYSVNSTFILIVIFSFIFSKYIEESNVAHFLANILSSYADIAVFLIPLIIVIGTGVEFTYIALAFPPLLPLFNPERLLLSFAGGFVGAMLSPAHACLVMSAEYYKTELPKTYRLILPATILTAILVILYVLFS
jgi:integral membrane protein (TIGR00529 family)